MKVQKLIELIEEQIPPSLAMDWDNVGLLVGDRDADVRKVYVALDATDQVIDHAIEAGADMILTHHPMIFSPLKAVRADDMTGGRVVKMVRNNISYYAMHTNFDVAVMGSLAASKLPVRDIEPLEVTCFDEQACHAKGIGTVGKLERPMTLGELAELTRDAFGLSHVKVFGNPDDMAEVVAMCPGSGKSDLDEAVQAGAQVYITGDIDHHTGIDGVAQGVNIIDAGHYGIEHIYIDYMREWLNDKMPELAVETEDFQEPFWIC